MTRFLSILAGAILGCNSGSGSGLSIPGAEYPPVGSIQKATATQYINFAACAVSIEAYNDLQRAIADNAPQAIGTYERDQKIWPVRIAHRIRIVSHDPSSTYVKVHILDGDNAGKEGWMNYMDCGGKSSGKSNAQEIRNNPMCDEFNLERGDGVEPMSSRVDAAREIPDLENLIKGKNVEGRRVKVVEGLLGVVVSKEENYVQVFFEGIRVPIWVEKNSLLLRMKKERAEGSAVIKPVSPPEEPATAPKPKPAPPSEPIDPVQVGTTALVVVDMPAATVDLESLKSLLANKPIRDGAKVSLRKGDLGSVVFVEKEYVRVEFKDGIQAWLQRTSVVFK